MGQKCIVERSLDDITEKLMQPAPSEEEENAQEGDGGSSARSHVSARSSSMRGSQLEVGSAKGSQEGEVEEKPKEMEADVIENDFIEKANLLPPQDPAGEETLIPDLVLTKDQISAILEKALNTVLQWLMDEKGIYNSKARSEGKNLQD